MNFTRLSPRSRLNSSVVVAVAVAAQVDIAEVAQVDIAEDLAEDVWVDIDAWADFGAALVESAAYVAHSRAAQVDFALQSGYWAFVCMHRFSCFLERVF